MCGVNAAFYIIVLCNWKFTLTTLLRLAFKGLVRIIGGYFYMEHGV